MWLVVLFIVRIAYADTYGRIVSTFTDQETVFNHLAIDYGTDRIYIGGVNNIYQLTADLKRLRQVVTGPVVDSTCSYQCDDIYEQKDNYNKVLLVDDVHDRLITCGSVFQGMCSVRSLTNIQIARDVQTAVVADHPIASTVAFLAPGPPNPITTQVMYTGVTYTGNPEQRHHVPAVSSRSLEEYRFFDIAKIFCEFCHSDQVFGTRMYINTMYRDRYIVNYIHGFSSGKFSYFLTTQQRPGGGLYSKIIRICHNDEVYNSYTETPISCKNENTYNIVTAGVVTKAGENLAENLNITTEEDVLYATFHTEYESTSTGKKSAICIFPVRDINAKIGVNIEKCFNGEGMRGAEHVWPNRHCVKHEMETNGADFCGSNINSPLGGELAIEVGPTAEFSEKLTAITARILGEVTRLYVGTSRGYVKEIEVLNPTISIELANIVIDEGSPVNKDLLFDTHQNNLYVMNERKLTKVTFYNNVGSKKNSQQNYQNRDTRKKEESLPAISPNKIDKNKQNNQNQTDTLPPAVATLLGISGTNIRRNKQNQNANFQAILETLLGGKANDRRNR